jgi:hypothetical protein
LSTRYLLRPDDAGLLGIAIGIAIGIEARFFEAERGSRYRYRNPMPIPTRFIGIAIGIGIGIEAMDLPRFTGHWSRLVVFGPVGAVGNGEREREEPQRSAEA